MLTKRYYVYILTNQRNTTIYTGVTDDLSRRGFEHKNKLNKKSFTARYNIDKLVYLEIYQDINQAITREKQIKAGSRQKKVELIEIENPEWKDLFE